MRTLFITICLSILTINCFAASARWTKKENWRKIKDDMPESEVIKLIGKPSYEKTATGNKVLYYSTKEPFVLKSGAMMQFVSIEYNEDANVILKRDVLKDNIFYVSNIREPDFSKIKDAQETMPNKQMKPIESLESWQKERAWKRIKYGMKEKTLVAHLGEPTIKKGKGRRSSYYYGKVPLWGVVVIDTLEGIGDGDDYVESWAEPFWYLLNKELYEEIKPPTKNDSSHILEIEEMKKETFLRFIEESDDLTDADKKIIRKGVHLTAYTHVRLDKYQQNGETFLMIDQYYPIKIQRKDSYGRPIVTGGSGNKVMYKLENEIWRSVENMLYD